MRRERSEGGSLLSADPIERRQIIEKYQGLISESESLADRIVRRDALIAASEVLESLPISGDLDQNKRSLCHLFDSADDWVIREFQTGLGPRAILTYVDGLVDQEQIDRHVLSPLMNAASPDGDSPAQSTTQLVLKQIVYDSQVECVTSMRDVVDGVLHGDAALFLDGEMQALVISERAHDKRPVGEPETEAVIRGP